MDLGFIEAGFDVIWANDSDAFAVETYNANIGDHAVCGDVGSVLIPEYDAGCADRRPTMSGLLRHRAHANRRPAIHACLQVPEARRPAEASCLRDGERQVAGRQPSVGPPAGGARRRAARSWLRDAAHGPERRPLRRPTGSREDVPDRDRRRRHAGPADPDHVGRGADSSRCPPTAATIRRTRQQHRDWRARRPDTRPGHASHRPCRIAPVQRLRPSATSRSTGQDAPRVDGRQCHADHRSGRARPWRGAMGRRIPPTPVAWRGTYQDRAAQIATDHRRRGRDTADLPGRALHFAARGSPNTGRWATLSRPVWPRLLRRCCSARCSKRRLSR